MNVSTSLRSARVDGSATPIPDAPDAVTVRPVRAAFGPHVSLVSVDNQGRLWVRFSTAMMMLVTAVVLMLIPLGALWYVGGGLVHSGQVSLRNDHTQPTTENSTVSTNGPSVAALVSPPNELPLADSGN